VAGGRGGGGGAAGVGRCGRVLVQGAWWMGAGGWGGVGCWCRGTRFPRQPLLWEPAGGGGAWRDGWSASQPIAVAGLQWRLAGDPCGTISADGVFRAGDAPGTARVQASAEGVQAEGGITVASATAAVAGGGSGREGAGTPGVPATPTEVRLSWSGVIPPTKWTTFYTKVLTKIAQRPGVSITVSFSAPLPPAEAEAKRNELQTGLRDLGMDDSVRAE
jgi:hypothetical protein